MKLATIITISFLQFTVFGQAIQHFDSPDSKWFVAKTYPAADPDNPNFAATTTSVFGFQGDTIINAETWNKMYVSNDSLFQNNLEFVGATRVENDQILFLDTLNQIDTLYDFSLNVGDSVLYNINGNNLEWLDIIEIDSIQINGDYYKRFHFDEPMMSAFDELDEVWIEGIGSIHGPLFPRYPEKFSSEIPDSMLLTCSFSSAQEVWKHPNYEECYINNVLNLNAFNETEFVLYPNPFETVISIESHSSSINEVIVLNNLGQVKLNIEEDMLNDTIDLSVLDSGVYYLKIIGDKNSGIIRVIKN